jgi:hypothetical protein
MKLAVFISAIFIANLSSAQIRTITGTIVDANMEVLPMVNIQNMDTVILGTTEMDGTFEIEVTESTNQLLISFIGMEWQTVQIKPNCDRVNVLLMYDGHYCHRSNKKNERRRRKYLAKQPELLELAYEQKVFGKEKPCR